MRPAGAAAAAAIAVTACLASSPARQTAAASSNTLRLFVSHRTVPQRGAVEIWTVAIFNAGATAATGFGASGRLIGANVLQVNCPLDQWGGIGSLPTFFECGNNGGYHGHLAPGALVAFTVSGTVTGAVGTQVVAAVQGLSGRGDAFVPPSALDTSVVGGGLLPTPTATPGASASAGASAGSAQTVGSGFAYTLLLAAAFVITSAGLFLVFTRQRRRAPDSTSGDGRRQP